MQEAWPTDYLNFNHSFTHLHITFTASLKLGYMILSLIWKFYHVSLKFTAMIEASVRRSTLIAIDDSLSSALLQSLSNLEVITVSLNFPGDPITLCTVCIPPKSDSSYHKSLLSYFAHIATSAKTLIITGDFNVPDICWSSLTATSLFSRSLCNFIYEFNLTQIITCPTHIKGNTLDLVITIVEDIIHNLAVSEPHPRLVTDHFTISFNIQHTFQSRPRNKSKYVFDYSKANLESICCHLLDTDFGDCFTSDSIEEVWVRLKNGILNATHMFIPRVK